LAQRCVLSEIDPDAEAKAKKKQAQIDNIVRLFEGIEGVINEASSVHLFCVGEEEQFEDVRVWNATVLREDGKRVEVQGRTLMDVMAALVDGQKEKICRTCKEPKYLTSFSVDRSQKDGRCSACRRCESIRVTRQNKQKAMKLSREKVCRQCGKTKRLREFTVDRSRPDGRKYYCKPCDSIRTLRQRRKNRPQTGTDAPEASARAPA
jgi:hypothetical protein